LARLVLFGAFACGSAVSQEASTPAGPPNIQVAVSAQSATTSNQPPGLSVLECKWEKTRRRDMSTPVIAPPKVNENTGQVMPPDDNTDLRHTNVSVPPEVSAKARRDDEKLMYSYSYSIKVSNAGAKKVRSMAWDYVFSDPGTRNELKRHSFRSFEQVSAGETKWIRLEHSPLNPPQMVTLEGLKKDQRSPFDERIEIKCLLYTDGTGWKAADTDRKTCDDLVKYTLHPLGPFVRH
jgi:hypothetical protein